MLRKLFSRYKHALLYGASLAAILFLLQFLEYRLLLVSHAFQVYVAAIAVVFTALGMWLTTQLVGRKVETVVQTVVVEKEVYLSVPDDTQPDDQARERLGLSARETEVLTLMADGCSNQEIADQLFLSLNTVKTHSSKLYEKLDVKRRTQAVEKAKRLKIIA